MKKFIALLVLFLAFTTSANAITFDPTGGTGTSADYIDVATWDWSPSSAVAVNGTITPEGGTFTLLTHGSISVLKDSSGGSVWSDEDHSYEITFVAGFSETITSSTLVNGTTSIQTYEVVSSGLNFFEVYIDTDTDADSSLIGDLSAGTGYGGESLAANTSQTLLFKGTVSGGYGSFASNFANTQLLDTFGDDDATAAFGVSDPETQQTVTGTGGTTIYSTIAFSDFNIDYFPDIDTNAILWMIFGNNTSNNIPFAQVDPSNYFYDGTATYYTPTIGNPNGAPAYIAGGTDVLFQMDSSMSEAGVVPEPTTLLLLGFGLIGVAGVTRRKKA